MTLLWSAKSKHQLKAIHDYYSDRVDKEFASQLVVDLIEKAEQLKNNPFLGQLEPLLISYKEKFRYLVFGNYKLIYFTDNTFIRIVVVFDCRQEPQKLKNLVDE